MSDKQKEECADSKRIRERLEADLQRLKDHNRYRARRAAFKRRAK